MDYSLRPASDTDKKWLDSLRRDAYQDLFEATWGGWDESRHQKHFSKTWDAGHISIVMIDGKPVGMIQILESDDLVEVAEFQILSVQQNRGLGSRVLEDVIELAYKQSKRISLYLGVKNSGAFSLYQRLGFEEIRRTDTHIFMEYCNTPASN